MKRITLLAFVCATTSASIMFCAPAEQPKNERSAAYHAVASTGNAMKTTAGTIIGFPLFLSAPINAFIMKMYEAHGLDDSSTSLLFNAAKDITGNTTHIEAQARNVYPFVKNGFFITVPLSFVGAYILYRSWQNNPTEKNA